MPHAPTPREQRQARRRARAAARGPGPAHGSNHGGGHKPPPPKHGSFKKAQKKYRRELRAERRKREADPYKKGKAATKGKKAPFVKPFMNAQDLMDYAQAHGKFAETLNSLDSSLENQRIAGQYEKTQIDRSRVQSSADSNDSMAARGLYHSSVRDAELDDIDATAALRKNYLDRQLDTAAIQNQTQKVAAQNAWDDFQRGMNQKEVENAQGVMLNTGKWLVDPTPKGKDTGYKPKPIAKPTGHAVHPDRGGAAGPAHPGGSGGHGGHHGHHGSGGTHGGPTGPGYYG